ncbi:Asp-tRNA(Asn)/Glu-tRNA(Gln) amidotransferase subunit GatA [Candidatus Dependentiae bacterium]|nr:Asp-tRNA(Asn)/Glu-tRNA(Gln) amidotransferase subunit GatA [Candidatus Dependentiae bacterium]
MKTFLTIKELKEKLEKKEIKKEEVISFYYNRLKKYNDKLNVALEIFEEKDLDKNNKQGILSGIPGLLKDNISQKGKITSCASKILENYKAPYDATVTKKLKDEGTVILGRANMDEFAMGSSGEFSAFGITKNPWDTNRVPGGSSSGSASAVAAGLIPWAIGTETGGSVRQPAAFCGLVGLYPTYGSNSRKGIVAFTSSTDQPGPLTKTVYDNALLSSILMGENPNDSTSLLRPKVDFTKNLTGKLPKNLTFGVIKDALESDGINAEVKKSFELAIKQLEKLGAKIKYIELPDLKYGISVYFIVSRAEAASNLARFDGSLYGMRAQDAKDLKEMYIKTRHDGFGPEVKRRILMGNYVLSSSHQDAYYKKADHVRAMLRAEFEQAFKEVDLLISPTTTTLPFEIGKMCNDPVKMYWADYFTVPNCITGNPALSIPGEFSKDGLPIGFQFIGPRLSEELIYQVAYAFEQSTDYHLKTPKGYE